MVSLKCKEIACYIYSALLFISGLILISVSCLMWYLVFSQSTFLPGDTTIPFVIIVFVGLLQLFLTWLAVKGPSTEHDFFIISSVTVVIVILVIEFSIGIYSTVLLHTLKGRTDILLQTSFSNHAQNVNYHKKEWNTLESKLECCGVNGPEDYGDRLHVPTSCCLNDIVGNKCKSIHKIGCNIPLVSNIKPLLRNIAIATFLTSLMHIGGVVVFIAFYKGLKLERLQRSVNRTRMRQSIRSHQTPPGPIPHHPEVATSHSPTAPVYS